MTDLCAAHTNQNKRRAQWSRPTGVFFADGRKRHGRVAVPYVDV